MGEMPRTYRKPTARRIAAWALLLSGCSSEETTAPLSPPACEPAAGWPSATAGTFERIEASFDAADPLVDRLCAEGATPPSELANPWDLHCEIAAGLGAAVEAAGPAPERLRVVTWNIKFGTDLAGVLAVLEADPVLSQADLLLLGEVDRGCTRSGGVDVARTIGEALGADWVFGVEFVEQAEGGCEEGNAIVSRVALGNAIHHFHSRGSLERDGLFAPYDWSLDADEPRTGRRTFVGADVRFGEGLLHVESAHLENRSSPEERGAEIQEIIDVVAALPRRAACIAGDYNVFPDLGTAVVDAPLFDALGAACFVNPHADLPQAERHTRPNLAYQIDFTYMRGVSFEDHAVVDLGDGGPSDHFPVWVDLVAP
jgi:endonuclease/exonuclease/phosphatase family metal-dependent hydrolase